MSVVLICMITQHPPDSQRFITHRKRSRGDYGRMSEATHINGGWKHLRAETHKYAQVLYVRVMPPDTAAEQWRACMTTHPGTARFRIHLKACVFNDT